MARTRYIKPGIITNEELCSLGEHAYILFTSLWMLADREGRLEDRPRRIKVEGMPFWDCNVDELLTQLAARNFIERYEVDGQRYIQIRTFQKHQHVHPRESRSVIPPPVNGTGQGNAKDMPRHSPGHAKADDIGTKGLYSSSTSSVDTVAPVVSSSGAKLKKSVAAAAAAAKPTAVVGSRREPPDGGSSSSNAAALAKDLAKTHPRRGSIRKAAEAIEAENLTAEQCAAMRRSHDAYVAYYARAQPEFIPNLALWVSDGDWLKPIPDDAAAPVQRKPAVISPMVRFAIEIEEEKQRKGTNHVGRAHTAS